jgi:hypothetical protein
MKFSIILLAVTATALNLPRAEDRGQPGRGGSSTAKGVSSAASGGATSASSAAVASSSTAASTSSANGACPAVWTSISQQLSGLFAGCNDMARAAIRAVFHDCFPSPGCDGSLAIQAELSRPINSPLVPLVDALKVMAAANKVGIADLLMFAGCKSGPLAKP